jgi:hypothetical protein
VIDMGSPVSGEVWVIAKHGQISPPNPNYIVVFGWHDINGWVFIGLAMVTAGYATNGGIYYVGSTSGVAYRYFAVGTIAMGGSNTAGNVWLCAFMVIN